MGAGLAAIQSSSGSRNNTLTHTCDLLPACLPACHWSAYSNSNNKNRLALDLGFGAGLGMRMQPTMGGPGVLANGVEAGPHVTRAVARWLESHNVQQYHQGLLVAVLISCGLWRDSMWEPLENGALRWVCWALLHLQDKGLAWLLAVGVHAPVQMVHGMLRSPCEADGQAAALVVAILGSGQLPGSLQLHVLTPLLPAAAWLPGQGHFQHLQVCLV